MPDLLTTEQLAEGLHLPVATVRYWRARNEGPQGFRVGRRVVYRRTEVERWLREQEAAARPVARVPAW